MSLSLSLSLSHTHTHTRTLPLSLLHTLAHSYSLVHTLSTNTNSLSFCISHLPFLHTHLVKFKHFRLLLLVTNTNINTAFTQALHHSHSLSVVVSSCMYMDTHSHYGVDSHIPHIYFLSKSNNNSYDSWKRKDAPIKIFLNLLIFKKI